MRLVGLLMTGGVKLLGDADETALELNGLLDVAPFEYALDAVPELATLPEIAIGLPVLVVNGDFITPESSTSIVESSVTSPQHVLLLEPRIVTQVCQAPTASSIMLGKSAVANVVVELVAGPNCPNSFDPKQSTDEFIQAHVC